MESLPDSVLLEIFKFIPSTSLHRLTLVCQRWSRVSRDEQLWRLKLLEDFTEIEAAGGATQSCSDWRESWAHLQGNAPVILAQKVDYHRDEILRANFSKNGRLLATVSKDHKLAVWTVDFSAIARGKQPLKLRASVSTVEYCPEWSYPRYAAFNDEGNLIAVSGKSFTKETAVFNLDGVELRFIAVIDTDSSFAGSEWLWDRVFANFSYSFSIGMSEHQLKAYEIDDSGSGSDFGMEGHFPKLAMALNISNAQPMSIRFLTVSKFIPSSLNGKPSDRLILFAQSLFPFDESADKNYISAILVHWPDDTDGDSPPLPLTMEPVLRTPVPGPVIGMKLSSDQRTLALNIREEVKDAIDDYERLEQPILRLLDVESFSLLPVTFSGHSDIDFDVSASFTFRYPDSNDSWVVSGSICGEGRLWSKQFGVEVGRFPHSNGVDCVVLSPTEPDVAASVSDDHSVKVWISRRRLAELKAQDSSEPTSSNLEPEAPVFFSDGLGEFF